MLLKFVRPRAKRVSIFAHACESLDGRTLFAAAFRPPAVPLVVSDPYLSVWSESDKLTDSNTVHWTGAANSLVSLVRIEGKTYRLLGDDPSTMPAFPQVGIQVQPLRTVADFDDGHVHVTMTFMQPAFGNNLAALSLPVTYLTWDVTSVDGKTHAVQVYDSVSSQLAVNTTDQQVSWQRGSVQDLTTLRIGTTAQQYFSPVGDQVRINWGYAYLAAYSQLTTQSIGGDAAEINAFVTNGKLSNVDDANVPRAVSNNQPVMAVAIDFKTVGAVSVHQHVLIAYDEVKSVNYFGEPLTPYWARSGTTFAQMLAFAHGNYNTYSKQAADFSYNLTLDMTKSGGAQYAAVGALAYRQTFAGIGLAADPSGQPLAFPKENSSNGDISTVDVLYPMFPQLLLFSPTLAKASLQPVMDYASSSQWTFPNAPHDLGTYPVLSGRPDGGEQMPVEETANMLSMLDGIAKAEHSAEFANQFWPLISKWANYLKPFANTPGLQLTTDDFLGVITNSTNLAVKAIIGLGAFADLAKLHGDAASAAAYTSLAQADVTHWMGQSLSSDGTHWLLTYGQQGTGTELYNLVFDKILGTNLFPATVAAKDIAYGKTVLTPLGVPIRSTTNIVGVDWSTWDASLATNAADFQAIFNPIYTYLNTATTRVPLRDKYDDTNLGGGLFMARTVVGGVFAKMLTDPAMWSKYASQNTQKLGVYAGFPVTTVVVPDARQTPQTWKYTTATPAAAWTAVAFNDAAWSSGKSGFGSAGTPGAIVNTSWTSGDIYLRRTFTMPAGTFSNLEFETYHDEDVQIYINGILAASDSGYVTNYTTLPISAAARALLVAGRPITIAVHCHQTTGGQGVDVGLVNLQPGPRPA